MRRPSSIWCRISNVNYYHKLGIERKTECFEPSFDICCQVGLKMKENIRSSLFLSLADLLLL